MKYFITLLALLSYLQGFGQTDYLLVNKLDCEMRFAVRVAQSGSCTFVSNTAVIVPPHTATTYTAPAGTEVMSVVVSFTVNNCVGINMSSPDNVNCPNCPNWFGTQGSWTSTCNNGCQGMPINWKWFQYCNSPDQIVVYH